MKKSELQDELNLRGLSPRGNTPELLDRLKKAMIDRVALMDKNREEAA